MTPSSTALYRRLKFAARRLKFAARRPLRAARRILAGRSLGVVADGAAPGGAGAPKSPFCGWTVDVENRRGGVVDGVSLRRYPFPYRCAVAINNDTDGFLFPAFEAFHRFVNGRQETPLGQGVGLEVADSFWFWSTGGQVSLYHAAPWVNDAAPSAEHERLIEMARAGWLDTLHGFGAWSEKWELDRDRIARALDYLDSRGVRLKVYVGHGGFNMTHNFGGPWGYYQHADDRGHPSYCLDLLRAYGFRYFWSDPFYELDKFGEDLTFESQDQLDLAVLGHDFHRFFYSNDPADFTRSREVFPGADEATRVMWRRRLFNRVLCPVTARDGLPVYAFKRFRGHDGPNAGNFIAQLNRQSLDALEARQGAVVVYQHFGVWRALFMGKGHASQRPSRPADVLDEHGIWAFRTLAERHREGRIMVATTRRLLDFIRLRDSLVFSVVRESDKVLIRLDGAACPAEGRLELDVDSLAGLAFTLRRSAGEPVILLRGRQLPAEVVEDPDDPAFVIAHLPWRALEYPY
jgi:hypothetical protein